jgi:phosphoribosylamine--glycine ligase
MKILIIGSGGREHALAWHVAKLPQVKQVYVAPGNGGTSLEAKTQNIPIAITAVHELVNFARQHAVDLTIIGPEASLAAGVVDEFEKAQLPCFGPTMKAAQLETSKAFSKDFMQRHNIPTAAYATFTDLNAAKDYLNKHPLPVVIKADGLAAGKGVVIANNFEAAEASLETMLLKKTHGIAGNKVVIEEFLPGEEASFIAMVDGETVLPLATSQDHKARDNHDLGPNTGGMGAYSPAPVITPGLQQKIMETVMRPVVAGMKQEGIIYRGFLYAGLMVSPNEDIHVLEFNCRLGDPETEPLLLRLQSNLVDACLAGIAKQLHNVTLTWDKRVALGVVLVAKGYPGEYPTGEIIGGLPTKISSDYKIFHAGTRLQGNELVTSGGRVLCVTSLGETTSEAQARAYKIISQIHWPHMYYRTDIGYRAIAREKETLHYSKLKF